jgi:two-component system, NarL family, sensor kinase
MNAGLIDKDIVLAVVCTTLLVLLLVAGIIIVFFIAGKQRVQQQMQLAEARLSFEREIRKVETEVSESVMNRFARELHDNIGQLLTALHIQLENQKLDHPELAESFKTSEVYIAEITQQLRMLSRTLNSDYIGHIGLLAAIQIETEKLTSLKRFAVSYKATGGGTNLDKQQELMVFRIFQEITQNALKYSEARQFTVTVDCSADGFEMRVQDDGHGFNKEEVLNSSRASGLRNIFKRASLSGIDCELVTAPGKGCLFILKKVHTLG